MDIKKNITKEKDGVTSKIEIVKREGFLFDKYAIRKTTTSIYKTGKVELVEYRDLNGNYWWSRTGGRMSNHYVNFDCFGSYSKVCKELVNLMSKNTSIYVYNEKVIKEIKNGN